MADALPPAARMSGVVRAKLAVMMFLELFIWGAWFELGFDYIPSLGFEGDWKLPLIFGAFNVGALVALFFSTQFADRKFAAERFMAASHLVSGLAILGLFFLPGGKGNPPPFWLFFGLMLLHSVLYVPTISIANSIAFANLRNPSQEFGPVRVWGTVGWIAASWPFIFLLADWTKIPSFAAGPVEWLGAVLKYSLDGAALRDGQRHIFLVAAVASFALAAFSLVLPHTPPKPATGGDSLAWLKAMRLLRNPAILVLFVVTFIDAAVHGSFFYWTASFLGPRENGGVVDIPANWVSPVMKIGQVAEILTMLALGYVLKRLGWRITMAVGVLGHAARFAVFAYYPEPWAAVLVNAVHGICYAFFFATVYIFVDEYFPKDVRSSAQGLFNALIIGIGPFAANFACGLLRTRYTGADDKLNYPAVFEYSMLAAVAGAAILVLFFHPRKPADEPTFSQVEKNASPAG